MPVQLVLHVAQEILQVAPLVLWDITAQVVCQRQVYPVQPELLVATKLVKLIHTSASSVHQVTTALRALRIQLLLLLVTIRHFKVLIR